MEAAHKLELVLGPLCGARRLGGGSIAAELADDAGRERRDAESHMGAADAPERLMPFPNAARTDETLEEFSTSSTS